MRVLWFPQVGADCIGTVGEHQDVEESGRLAAGSQDPVSYADTHSKRRNAADEMANDPKELREPGASCANHYTLECILPGQPVVRRSWARTSR